MATAHNRRCGDPDDSESHVHRRDIDRDTAYALARMGRTLYVDKKDDADKGARYTASAEMLKAAEEMTKAKPSK